MLTTSMAMAVPAYPGKASVKQPDGSLLTIRLMGDEYLHFNTTDDGYTIVQRADGYYVYAQLDQDKQLAPTSHIAHDANDRQADEQVWLQATPKRLTPMMTDKASKEYQAEVNRRSQALQAARASNYDYSKFKGLVLLVQYNDQVFSRADYIDIANNMINQKDFDGYDQVNYTGSVRDYFYDNSNGIFDPQFDVIGPVNVNRSKYFANGTKDCAQLMLDVVDAADSLVNFSQYDGDKDGTVDMIYFIFAGFGSNFGTNDSRLIWPHAAEIYRPNSSNWMVRKDGVRLGRYACSTELYGDKSWNTIDGIGVMCHEFSHVLGLMDHYDTDYEKSGGESNHPGEWDLMAGAPYLNYARTPAGYNLFERYTLGFANPQLIDSEGSFTLDVLPESNMGYRLNAQTANNKEYFLIENRQKKSKWDKYLSGHGMLVYRVDSTNVNVWRENTVNANPKHNYFELVRAKGGSKNPGTAQAHDPFPGSANVTTLNNTTDPANLMSWAGKPSLFGFDNISESSNGIITFDVVDVNTLKSISLPEVFTINVGLSTQLVETRVPDYAPYTLKWSTSDPNVVTVDTRGIITGRGVGTAIVTVKANNDDALTARCTVKVEELITIPDIATYKSLDEEAEGALNLTDALVIFTNDEYVFLRDATGAIQMVGTELNLKVGDMLNGFIYGRLATVNGLKQLQGVEFLTNSNGYSVSGGNEVLPRELTLEELSEADRCDLVTIKGTALEKKSGYWAFSGERRVRLYNSYQLKGITVPTLNSKGRYDVTGLYITNKLSGNIIDEIQMTQSVTLNEEATGIDNVKTDPSQQITIYTTDGRLVGRTSLGALQQLSLRSGIYIIKSTNKTWRMAR